MTTRTSATPISSTATTASTSTTDISTALRHLTLPEPNSHKGQNGKLLLIGGSDLFHAASKWSLDVASKFVDMVFYASVPSNNQLIQEAKQNFWNGIVIARENIPEYIDESDCILIGPGMDRSPETEKIVNDLLAKYPHKKWVIDAGALQMVNPQLLTERCIVTPHHKEFADLQKRAGVEVEKMDEKAGTANGEKNLQNICIVLKGVEDLITFGDQKIHIPGGNAGMTKGGTGDVLAGLIAGLYTTHDTLTAAIVGSYINKKAGESLWKKVGPYFNASDLVSEIPVVLWEELQAAQK